MTDNGTTKVSYWQLLMQRKSLANGFRGPTTMTMTTAETIVSASSGQTAVNVESVPEHSNGIITGNMNQTNANNKHSVGLNTFDLTGYGLSATLAIGIFLIVGYVAKFVAGPSVILSIIIAAICSFLAGNQHFNIRVCGRCRTVLDGEVE